MKRGILTGGVLFVLLSTSLLITSSAQQMGKMGAAKLPPKVEKQLQDVRRDLNALKGSMPGLACCIGPVCSFCPLVDGKCSCGMTVRTDAGVCGECYDGWHAGQGRMPGVKAADVKHWNKATLESMFKARAALFSK